MDQVIPDALEHGAQGRQHEGVKAPERAAASQAIASATTENTRATPQPADRSQR